MSGSGDQDPGAELAAKLIAAKERWAKEQRLITGEKGERRLPPGQHLTKDWPVLDLGVQPAVDQATWKLTVNGAVERPLVWCWADFLDQPQIYSRSDIHCVTSWSRYDNHWKGVSARHLLDLVRPKPEARFVVFKSHDAYTTNLPLAAFADEDVLLASHWEDQPLSREHGGPVRVVVPKLYFWKSAKWVRSITFVAKDQPGFWEVRGYHNNGDPWTEERYG